MDQGQARNPNTAYNGYKMEFWKFAFTWKLICPVQHKITQKEQKKQPRKEEYPLPYWAKGKPTTQYINPSVEPTKR